MKIRIMKIRGGRYVDCSLSDCMPDGYYEPGRASLRTVDEFPVSELPQAECEQFGHETAYGLSKIPLRSAMHLFKAKRLEVGMEIDVEPKGIRRNREMRKCGYFRFYV